MSRAPDTVTDTAYEAARDAQARAARPDRSAWVAANAGSGKTKVLIDRVARLLLKGAAPDTILCVTYTKAAASEMQDRLFRVLGDWSVMEAGKLKAELAQLEDRTDHTDDEAARARALFASALETPGGLRIETIHAFCGRVLRRFPLEAGVAPGFRELDETETGVIWEDSFAALGARIARRRDLALNAAASVVAEAGNGLGVLRGLGAQRGAVRAFLDQPGGVDGAIEKLARTLRVSGETPDDIIARAMGADLPRASVSAIAAALPTAKPTDAKLSEALAFILSDAPADQRFDAWSSLAFTDKGEPRKGNPYTADAVKRAPAIADLFQIKDAPQGEEIIRILSTTETLRAALVFERSAALLRLADTVLSDFTWRKGARAGLDFDDLIDRVSHLLSPGGSAAAEWVLWKLDGGVSHVLLDEAQDTSPAQWEILESLTNDIFAGMGVERRNPRTMFVVGDQKQSIYSFQGADPEHFLRQARSYQGRADASGVAFEAPHLAMSFRSVPQVLRFVDEVFDPQYFGGGAPFSIEPPTEADVAPHTARRAGHPGAVDLWPLEPPPSTPDANPWDAPVDQELETSPRARLARRIAAFVKAEITRGAAVWDGPIQRPAKPGDFLILVRGRMSGLFDGVLQALKREGLPVAGADRIQLLDSLAVQDLLNLVRFALCPDDDLVVAEILKGPFGGVSEEALFTLAHDRGRASLASRVAASADPFVAPARDFLAALRTRRFLPAFDFLSYALDCEHGEGQRGWDLMLSRFGDPAREPVAALVDRAAAFDAETPASLELFLAAIESHGGEVKRELSGPQDEVRVMTVHGAKGLEAPIVILPDTTSAPRLDTGSLFVTPDGAPVWAGKKADDTPETRALRTEANERALREHRRLLYVALTRARDRLVVCGAWIGKDTTAGRHDESWFALCERAMERLAATGSAAPADLDLAGATMTSMRVGDAPPDIARGSQATIPSAVLPAWVARPAAAERQARRVLSPSSLGGGEPPVMAPFGEGREARLRRGRLIHALFQHLPDIAMDQRRDAATTFLSRQPDLTDRERAEMLGAAFGVIEDTRFAKLFAPGGRAEAPVVGRWGGDIVNGRIDRLVVTDTEVLVIDYKTDRPAPPSIAGVGDSYILQMAAYRGILRQSWPDRPVRCLLAWTDGPQLMEIPPETLDRAVESARQGRLGG